MIKSDYTVGDVRMETLEIMFDGFDGFVYANGRQQAKLRIKARKQIVNQQKHWVNMPLSDDEKNSIELMTLNNHENPPKGVVYKCCSDGYNFGPLNVQKTMIDEIASVEGGDGYEYISLFVSTNTTQAHDLVAFINLDGEKNWWHSDDAGTDNTFITLEGKTPYSINASDMKASVDDAYYYHNACTHIHDVDVYYWTLPHGLTMTSLAISGGMRYANNELYFFQSGWDMEYIRWSRLYDMSITSLTVGDCTPGSDRRSGDPVPYNASNVHLTATRYKLSGSSYHDAEARVTGIYQFVDNFGCKHELHVQEQTGDSNLIELIDA